jgi:putative FmdB family regulatory protein
MPIIVYSCECGENKKKFFRSGKDAPTVFVCPKCGKNMARQLSGPNLRTTLVVDNGVQARSLEIDPNIAQQMEERSQKNLREK